MMKIPLRIPVIHFQAIWNLNCPLKLGCLCWVLCLQPSLSPSALLGDTHGTPANCPPHPAAHHTLCQSPPTIHDVAVPGPCCTDECGRGQSVLLDWVLNVSVQRSKRMIPILEALSSPGMGRETELSEAGLAVHYSMTHRAVSFWTFLQCVLLCLGLFVFWQNGQCPWSLTFMSPVYYFPYQDFFWRWENVVDKTTFWIV